MHGANLGTLLLDGQHDGSRCPARGAGLGAEDVLIVRGVVADLGPPAAVLSVVAALAAKHTSPQDRQYLPGHDPAFDVVYAVRPRSAMAWRLDDYAASQRRWTALS